jgi:hypothetical protein
MRDSSRAKGAKSRTMLHPNPITTTATRGDLAADPSVFVWSKSQDVVRPIPVCAVGSDRTGGPM